MRYDVRRLKARVRSVWQSLWRAGELDAAMREEMRFHIDMEADRLMREHGLDLQEARRRSHVAFGGVSKFEEEGRDTRALRWADAISLDARLGLRMLVKHRGLTLVGGFAMAVAIAAGAASFEVMSEILNSGLPFENGERVVAVRYVSSDDGSAERRVLHDFVAWREELVSVKPLGAFRTVEHNLTSGTAPPEPVKIAEITASGFAVARAAPLLGRYLLPSDERDGASPVVVIGHHAWQSRFGGDPHIVSKTITLAGTPHVVVGVMPNGFKFPVDHQFWIPLRTHRRDYQRLEGPQVYMFGLLAPGHTLKDAQAELAILGQRNATAHPETHGQLRPVVIPYTREHLDLTHPSMVWALRIGQLLIGALSFVVAINLAILVYARTVARLGEIAVRTALGASRQRIVAQLFIEALALSGVGAAAGLVLARLALGRIQLLVPANGSVPFWLDFTLSVGTVMYAVALAVLAAVIMGVLPGLKATGGRLHATLRELSGRTGTRLGPMWTVLIVAQVAVAVAVLPVAVFMAWQVVRMEIAGPGFAAETFVVGMVALGDRTSGVDSNRVRARHVELVSRLEAEPGVSAVTFSSSIPGFSGDRRIQLEDGAPLRDAATLDVSTLQVGVDLFGTYGAAILAGRPFNSADLGAANAVVVNRAFTRQFLENRSPLGLRFHYARAKGEETQATEWYHVVGVVRDFPSFPTSPGSEGVPTVYHPAAPGDVHPFVLSVRFSHTIPPGFIERFRTIGAEVDPALQLNRVVQLSGFYDEVRSLWRHLAWGIALVTCSVLLLSAAGIYALTSFTVAQRTREIGIRTALGARPHQLLLSVFGRVTRQLVLGLLAGSLMSGAIFLSLDLSFGRAASLLLSVAGMMVTVGLLAALGPALRGLRIQASDALRTDA
jgi:predicted permease